MPIKKFISVSKILYALKKPFDEKKMSLKCSENPNHEHYGKKPDDIIKIWREKAQHSRVIGNNLDNYIDISLTNSKENVDYSKIDLNVLDNRNLYFEKFKNDIIEKFGLELVSQEDTVMDIIKMIYGRIDAIFLWNNKLVIFDWKSNEELTTESDFKLLYPFDYLDNSKLTEYTLQVYLYRWILEQAYILEKPINGCRIIHLNSKGYSVIKPKFDYNPIEIENIIDKALYKIKNGTK